MSYLPAVSIVLGYAALIYEAGWWGVGLGTLHIAVLLWAASRRAAEQRRPK